MPDYLRRYLMPPMQSDAGGSSRAVGHLGSGVNAWEPMRAQKILTSGFIFLCSPTICALWFPLRLVSLCGVCCVWQKDFQQ